MVDLPANATSEISGTIEFVSPIITKIIIALLIALFAFIIGKIVEKFFLKLFELTEFNKLIGKLFRIKGNISKTISSILAYVVYLIGLVMALNKLELTTAIIRTVVILLIVVFILFIIFGINDQVANLTAGMMIRARKNIKPGDYIKVKDRSVEGKVVAITSFNVQLETGKDEIVYVPNMMIFNSGIVKKKSKK